MKGLTGLAQIAVWTVVVLVTAALAGCFAGILGACGVSPSTVVDPAAYAAELQGCVAQAKTRAEADTCRHAVDVKYGQTDGG